MRTLALVLLFAGCAPSAPARGCTQRSPARSAAVVRAFKCAHPCPATGLATGACPGWQVDHVVPLCCGGADEPSNLRWLTTEQHRARHAGGVRCEG